MQLALAESKVEPVSMSKQVHLPSENIPLRPKTSNSNSSTQHSGSSQCEARDEVDKAEVKFPKGSLTSPDEVQAYKKRKLFLDERTNDKVHNLDGQLGHDRCINIDNQLVQVSRVTDDVRSASF